MKIKDTLEREQTMRNEELDARYQFEKHTCHLAENEQCEVCENYYDFVLATTDDEESRKWAWIERRMEALSGFRPKRKLAF